MIMRGNRHTISGKKIDIVKNQDDGKVSLKQINLSI